MGTRTGVAIGIGHSSGARVFDENIIGHVGYGERYTANTESQHPTLSFLFASLLAQPSLA